MTARLVWLAVASLIALQPAAPGTPQAVVDELLATDREFAARAVSVDVIAALTPMFDYDVVLYGPGGPVTGKVAADASLRSNADNAKSRLRWSPIRGGVSADAQHGFTAGYMTLTNPAGEQVPLKYLAYWIKGPAGWRVAVYKRMRSPQAPASVDLMPASLPSKLVPVRNDPQANGTLVAGLRQAEQSFSDAAQKIGLGPAFAQFGSADAINLGPGPAMIVGAANIGKSIGADSPDPVSPVVWSADRAIVASSGDFGVTMGTIRQKAPGADGKPVPGAPFFTIWRRADAKSPWRYIAE
jgi:ketosteroid isomerase-like protein